MGVSKFLYLIVFVLLLFSSCKKQVVYTDRQSFGTLKAENGNCLPINVHGVFQSGDTLLVSNYIDIHVHVDSVGAYSIASDTVNGFYFKGIGTLGYKGDTLIRLYGHGTPLAEGVNTFTISYSGTSCSVDVLVERGVHSTPPYTFDMAGGTCSGAIVNGVYHTGEPLSATNTVQLKVNVITPGAYTITSTTVNGIYFSGSGTFPTTGPQAITLTGNGIPLVYAPTSFTVAAGSSSCKFIVNVTAPFYFTGQIRGSDVYYQVDERKNIYNVIISGNYEATNISNLNTTNTLGIEVGIYKNFGHTPTEAERIDLFHIGTYDYGSVAGLKDGVVVYYFDGTDKIWTSEDGPQTASTFSITEFSDASATDFGKKIFTAKLNCKLYNGTNSIDVVNGEIRGLVISR